MSLPRTRAVAKPQTQVFAAALIYWLSSLHRWVNNLPLSPTFFWNSLSVDLLQQFVDYCPCDGSGILIFGDIFHEIPQFAASEESFSLRGKVFERKRPAEFAVSHDPESNGKGIQTVAVFQSKVDVIPAPVKGGSTDTFLKELLIFLFFLPYMVNWYYLEHNLMFLVILKFQFLLI